MVRRLSAQFVVAFAAVTIGLGAAVVVPGETAPPPRVVPAAAAPGSLGGPGDSGLVASIDVALSGAIVWSTGVQLAHYFEALAAQDAARRASSPRGGGGGGRCVEHPVNYGRDDGSYSIPTAIVLRESNGNYGSCNESSGACGAYQVLPSTWDGYAGYGSACDAPPDVQDQWAAEAYAQSGTQPWGG